MRLFDRAVVRVLPAVPRSVVRRVASPYIAGSTLADARRVAASLNAEGMRATVDVLGEEIAQIVHDVIGRSPRKMRTLDTGDGLVVLVTLGLPGETTLAAAHDEASEVEERIRAAFPDIADVVVHTEP